MREVFPGERIEAGQRYDVVTVNAEGVEERRHCLAGISWKIPESDVRFFVHE